LGTLIECSVILSISLLQPVEESGEDSRPAAGDIHNTMEKEYLSGDDSTLLIEHNRHASYDTLTLFVGPIDRERRAQDRRKESIEFRQINSSQAKNIERRSREISTGS
jgi:hypothetical protein